MITLTPLYDGLLAEAFSRARSSEAAADRAADVAALHTSGPTGRCLGCGLTAPCPTTALLDGSLTLGAARSAAEQALLASTPTASLPAEEPTSAEQPETEGELRALPTMPSAADIFAPNPAFARALSVLLGGS